MYYIGIITTVILIPWWSDKIGRRSISLANFYIFMIAIFGIVVGNDLIMLYIMIFIAGATFPARAIVAMSWLLEF